MPAKALLNELQSLQTFQYWQVENVSCSASSKNKANKKTKNAVTSSLLMNNDNEHLVDMNKSDDNVVIVHQSSHDSNSTTDTVKKHPNIDKNKVNLNNETNENRSTGCRVGDERIQQLEKRVSEMESTIQKLTSMLSQLMTTCVSQQKSANKSTPAQSKAKPAPANNDDDDDDVDLFGSDDDEAADELRQKRLDEYAAKKAKKPAAVAKSSVVLDIKPWDDETDMKEMERLVRTVKMDGLVWGASKLVPLAYGIKKLQIVCVIEDEKVSVEELGEKLTEFEDHVQSVDVAAFNKI